MNPIPQPSDAKPDLARKLRETCVHFTEAADESFFFRQLYLLIAAIFGKIEDMFLLWREGNLPPPPVRAPAHTPHARTRPRATARRHKTTRRRATARPNCARSTARRPKPHAHTPTTLKPSAPVRRIDRYPKSARKTHAISIA